MKFRILLSIFLIVVAFLACSELEQRAAATNCQYKINTVTPGTPDLIPPDYSLPLDIKIDVKNPNEDTDAVIDRMKFKLYAPKDADSHILDAENPVQVTVPAGGQTNFTVQTSINDETVVEAWNVINGGSVTYKITGTVYVTLLNETNAFEVTIYEDDWSNP